MFEKLHFEIFPFTFRINGIKKDKVEEYLKHMGFKCDNIDKSGEIWWFEDKSDIGSVTGSYNTKSKYISIKIPGELSDEIANYLMERIRRVHE